MRRNVIGVVLLSPIFLSALLEVACRRQGDSPAANVSYQGYVVAPSYAYEMTGRKDRVKGYVMRVDRADQSKSPGLVILASGIGKGEGYVNFNGNKYEIPGLLAESHGAAVLPSEKNQPGKEGWYSFSSGDDIVGKIVIPLNPAHLASGINEVEFFRNSSSDGYDIIDARLESVKEAAPTVIGQTYHLLARGKAATIRDFDFVIRYRSERKRSLEDIPEWARRGKVNFYRAGIEWKHLDRMFEMFKEARINLVATNVPRDIKSEAYRRTQAFIDRCHAGNIRVTGFNSLGNLPVREVLMHPEMLSWISRDEYGIPRWREANNTFAGDLQNEDYRRSFLLKQAEIQLDAGVDELYYDFSIGGTGDVIHFLDEVRKLAASKGKNISIFGNCKGNILVDELCDLTKSEGTTEAGVWDGKWVQNAAQARFYYASGYGVKSYESKYEGADPGVPNPGARDVREGMKCGWKKPIAEASAFQSHFAIAEANDKLRMGWILKDNSIAAQSWSDISRYFAFLAENQDLYTDVTCVSKVGVISPPHIPSFEVSLKRDNLYNALVERNVMYEVLLLHRLSPEMLSRFSAVIIPNIPWVADEQLAFLRAYKKNGGKLYTIGSRRELQAIADVQSPAAMLVDVQSEKGREELVSKIKALAGAEVITLSGAKYVAANVVKKINSERVVLHLVNYDKPARNIRVSLNLDGVVKQIGRGKIRLLSPDGGARDLTGISASGTRLEFIVSNLDVYDVVTIND